MHRCSLTRLCGSSRGRMCLLVLHFYAVLHTSQPSRAQLSISPAPFFEEKFFWCSSMLHTCAIDFLLISSCFSGAAPVCTISVLTPHRGCVNSSSGPAHHVGVCAHQHGVRVRSFLDWSAPHPCALVPALLSACVHLPPCTHALVPCARQRCASVRSLLHSLPRLHVLPCAR